MFLPETAEMPVGTPAPLNKRKKAPKIITDLAHITQDGKMSNTFLNFNNTFSLMSMIMGLFLYLKRWVIKCGNLLGVLIHQAEKTDH